MKRLMFQLLTASCGFFCVLWCDSGAWTATFYETNRQEPKIYTLTGDLPSSIVVNPDNTFTLTAYSVRLPSFPAT